MKKPHFLAIIQNKQADGSWEYSGKKVGGWVSLLNFIALCWKASTPEHIIYAAGLLVTSFFALKVYEVNNTKKDKGEPTV
jgi:hypothetical protein